MKTAFGELSSKEIVALLLSLEFTKLIEVLGAMGKVMERLNRRGEQISREVNGAEFERYFGRLDEGADNRKAK